nr:DUF4870 domain-containing protein [Pseudomonadota bacterium]
LILPIILWQIKKDQYPFVDVNGKNVVNFIISFLIYTAISYALTLILIGFLGLAILGVLAIVFPIIGGLKAYQGEVWVYPLTIKFF